MRERFGVAVITPHMKREKANILTRCFLCDKLWVTPRKEGL